MTQSPTHHDGTKKPKPRHYIEYGALRAFSALVKLFGPDRSSTIGSWLLRKIGPLTKYDQYARANLKMCLPELSETETNSIVHDMWDNFGRTFGEFFFHAELANYGPDARVKIEGQDHLERALSQGKSVIFFSGHFANWELVSPYILSQTGNLAGVYRAANNPLVNKWIHATRASVNFTNQLAKGRAGAKGTVECVRKGEHMAMLLDQKMNEGLDAPFFGHNAKTASAAALLAVKYGCILVPVHIRRQQGAHFVVRFYEPLPVRPTGDRTKDVLTVTTQYNQFLEDRIREVPGQWFWMHNRWTTPKRKRYTKRPNYKAD